MRNTHLRVQDLSADDIKIYVTTNFDKIPELKDLLTKDPITTKQIVDEILQKAEGVSPSSIVLYSSLFTIMYNFEY